MTEPVFPMRINKYLALKKHSTRRGADELIEKGQVFINGKLAVLGAKVGEDDNVEVRFRGKVKPFLYFAYNKPRGVITHSAGEGEKDIQQEIKDIIPIKGVFPIGRLDKDSHGLIILTNDGRITERLLGPAYEHTKVYVVKTTNPLRASFKKNMEAGVKIESEKTKPCKVDILSDHLFKVTLTEGKKHQIRRMCSALFQEVEDLKRVQIMNVELGKLPQGGHREIVDEELKTFLHSLELG
ncbi:MAG: pseudouridine synthase [bacterium]|nr:pseudouridine synthase [bacterium]